MAFEYTTSPITKQEPEVIKNLRAFNYDVKENNGKYYVDGYQINTNDPIWVAEAKIKTHKNDVIKDIAKREHQRYDEIVEQIKEEKKKDSLFTKLWHKSKNQLYSILDKNNAKKIQDIEDSNEREIAAEYNTTAQDAYAAHRRASNSIFTLGNEGVDAALTAGSFDRFIS